MIKAAKNIVGIDSDDKCEDKIQEKAANKIYEQLWPILSDRLCSKFEENAENMSSRITDYMMHQLEEKPALIMPIVQKMLEIMKPITNNTEDERKNLVELLERITNKVNELKNSEEIARSNAPPEPIETKKVIEEEKLIGNENKPENNVEVQENITPAPQNGPSGLLGLASNVASYTPMGALASAAASKLPINPSSVIGDMASKLPVNPSALGDMASQLKANPAGAFGSMASQLPINPSSAIGDMASKLPVNPSALGSMASQLPINPSSAIGDMASKLPTTPASLGNMASGLGANMPSGASGLLGMASKAKELGSAQQQAVKTAGGSRMMRTYKNRLIKKLYGKTRAIKAKRVSPKKR